MYHTDAGNEAAHRQRGAAGPPLQGVRGRATARSGWAVPHSTCLPGRQLPAAPAPAAARRGARAAGMPRRAWAPTPPRTRNNSHAKSRHLWRGRVGAYPGEEAHTTQQAFWSVPNHSSPCEAPGPQKRRGGMHAATSTAVRGLIAVGKSEKGNKVMHAARSSHLLLGPRRHARAGSAASRPPAPPPPLRPGPAPPAAAAAAVHAAPAAPRAPKPPQSPCPSATRIGAAEQRRAG